MIDWGSVRAEYNKILEKLNDGASLPAKDRVDLQKRSSLLNGLLETNDELEQVSREEAYCVQLISQGDELSDLYKEELISLKAKQVALEKKLEDKLYPADEHDDNSVFLEIRAGTGGLEAGLFVADLFRMYTAYANSLGWEVSVVDISSSDIGGCKELIAYIKGKGVYRSLKFESGVHRVQRVPATEGAGRIHTSTVTVAVLPEVDEVEISINQSDLRIDYYRSSGAGGQHVNTTDSAVRITHIPTGVVVTCQDERSQIKNKAKAMKVLQARIYEAEKQKLEAERSSNRKSQIGTGERSEKIRTYNYPQNRITDHRVDVTLKKLDLVMNGDMQDLIDPLIENERIERRNNARIV
ncbi:peptide chain release factor 1 [Candidatus Dependentiae bacterium]|nr:peptide chain release factor 1 [Candidatus Dependentiae bacterium]